MNIVFLGLSITSSWGNGHATTYRALLKALCNRGHDLEFLECDRPWYAANRDLANPSYCDVHLYDGLSDLAARFQSSIRKADVVIVGSYVPDGIQILEWVCETATGIVAFYDVDTPVTLATLEAGTCGYLDRRTVTAPDLYLSFSGGPALDVLEKRLRVKRARPLYCSVDPDVYRPTKKPPRWDLGYMGTYSEDRQEKMKELLIEPALQSPSLRFMVAGPQYPASISWPTNVDRCDHLSPDQHPEFYGSQRFALNITRADMVALGWSPSIRLFEAAACGTAIITDRWKGIDTFFEPGNELLVADTAADVTEILSGTTERQRERIGASARDRVQSNHSPKARAEALEGYLDEVYAARRSFTAAGDVVA